MNCGGLFYSNCARSSSVEGSLNSQQPQTLRTRGLLPAAARAHLTSQWQNPLLGGEWWGEVFIHSVYSDVHPMRMKIHASHIVFHHLGAKFCP